MKTNYQNTIQRFYLLLEQKDLNNWIRLWSEDATITFPYACELVNKSLHGREAINRYGRTSCDLYARLSFSIEDVFVNRNKGAVFLKTQHLISNSQDFYRDSNIGIFEFKKWGKISSYTEYFDPLKPGNTINLITLLK